MAVPIKLKGSVVSMTLVILLGSSGISATGTESCFDLGFTSNLLCSSCEDLKQFSLENLQENCRSCCQKEDEDLFVVKVPFRF